MTLLDGRGAVDVSENPATGEIGAIFAGCGCLESTTSGVPASSYSYRKINVGIAVHIPALVLWYLVKLSATVGLGERRMGVSSGPRERIGRSTGVYGAGPGTEGD
jgi:hypothetical protein